ncbi:unnamed protein product, partial [Ixodes pacificus]
GEAARHRVRGRPHQAGRLPPGQGRGAVQREHVGRPVPHDVHGPAVAAGPGTGRLLPHPGGTLLLQPVLSAARPGAREALRAAHAHEGAAGGPAARMDGREGRPGTHSKRL